jgi:LysM repeat protein
MSRLLAAALALPLFAVGFSPASSTPAPDCRDGYTVGRGDTLYSIARRCRSSVVAIAEASVLDDPRRIEIGQRLNVPGPAGHGYGHHRPDAGQDQAMVYRFQRSDTLYSLARWAGVSLRALRAANPGVDPTNIEIGDLIRLPRGARRPEPMRFAERGAGAVEPRHHHRHRRDPGPRDDERRDDAADRGPYDGQRYDPRHADDDMGGDRDKPEPEPDGI